MREHAEVDVHEAVGPTRAVVLVLHGGKAESVEQSEPTHLSSRRMNPFVRSLHKGGKQHGVAVWKVRYRVRGWNGVERSPVSDALWALDEVRRRHGDVPVVLVGHSMGGRTAVHVLGDSSVVGAVLLCPWLPNDPVEVARGKRVLLAHGVVDRWTSPAETRRWAEAARPFATALTYVQVRATGHFMLRRARLWTQLVVGPALGWLDADPSVGRLATKVMREATNGTPMLIV